MKRLHFLFPFLLPVLVIILSESQVAKATSVEIRKYSRRMVEQNITGTVVEHFTARSKLECSDR